MPEQEIAFEIDKQTLRDIDLLDHGRPGLVFAIFNNVKTSGGLDRLDKMLRTPMQDIELLEARRDSIRFFVENSIPFPFGKQQLDAVERYLSSGIAELEKNTLHAFLYEVRNKLNPTANYYSITTGIKVTIGAIWDLFKLVSGFRQTSHIGLPGSAPHYLSDLSHQIQEIISSSEISENLFSPAESKLSAVNMARCDHFFRRDGKGRLRMLLDCIYELDVFQSVAIATRKHNLSFPQYIASNDSKIQVQGLFHPLLTNPVSNDFNMKRNANLCFITGANMSGKSTFLKSFGLTVYLAHLGFPVPAQKMETTIFNGLITTINLSDNINRGYSHFYSEVKRVKETTLKIKEKKKIVVIFDELFRGTNVKDASDASLLITSAFSRIKNSLFLISTHIVEIADELKKHDNIFFACFDSTLEGETPTYSYTLKPGISRERVGMLIIRNERIVELLDEVLEA